MKQIIIFLFAIALYYLQGIAYSSESLFSKLLLVFIIIFCLFYWIKEFTQKNHNVFKCVSFFVVLNILWFLISIISSDVNLNLLKPIMLALLPFFPFYYAGKKGNNLEIILFAFLIVFLIISYFQYLQFENMIKNTTTREQMDVVNNIGYNFILLLPMLILTNRKPAISIFFVLLMTYFVILSSKRGALLCLGGGLLIYIYYIYQQMKETIKLKRFLITITILIGLSMVFYKFMYSNNFLISRLEDINNTSGRDRIIELTFNYWSENISSLSLLFGFGFCSMIDKIGAYAHNDWIEIFFDYGLIGLITYITLLFSIYTNNKNEIHTELKYAIISIVIIWILKSFTTGVFTGENTFLLLIVLGYSSGLQSYYNQNLNMSN